MCQHRCTYQTIQKHDRPAGTYVDTRDPTYQSGSGQVTAKNYWDQTYSAGE